MIDRALVVAGPIADVEAFEAMASERRQAGRPLTGRAAVALDRWHTKPALPSLRPLLRLLERLPRRELRSALPRIKGSRLESRMETIDGKLRLEYWFAAAGPFAAIRRLCRDVAAERPSLTFVVAGVNPNGSAARSFLVSPTGVEHYRLSPERRQIHVRRANREWAHISPRIALAEAAHAILRETAARWDLRLAGVSSGKRPYRPAADDSDWVFFKYVKDVYAEYGMSVDVGGDDESTADDEVDAALLERAETHWDSRVLRLFNRKSS